MADRALRVVRPGDPIPTRAARMLPDGAIVVDGTVVGHIDHPGARAVLNDRNQAMPTDEFPPGGRVRTPDVKGMIAGQGRVSSAPPPPARAIPGASRKVITTEGLSRGTERPASPDTTPLIICARIVAYTGAGSAALVIVTAAVRLARWIAG